MARKKKGKITGSIGDSVEYSNKYGDIVQGKGGADSETYHRLDSMRANRNNGTEFGFGSHYSKMLRDSLAVFSYLLRTDLHADLSRVFKLTIMDDKLHDVGKRSLDIRLNGDNFNNYSLSKSNYNSLSLVPFTLNISEDRKLIRLEIPPFIPLEYLTFPGGTTHYRFFMAATVINKFEYDVVQKHYIPRPESEFAFSKSISSAKYRSTELMDEASLDIEFDFVPDIEHLVIVSIGVEFSIVYEEREKTNVDWCGMKVLKVA